MATSDERRAAMLLMLDDRYRQDPSRTVGDTEIADVLQLDLVEVRRQLDILEERGFTRAANTHGGHSAWISPRGMEAADRLREAEPDAKNEDTRPHTRPADARDGSNAKVAPNRSVFVVHGRNLAARDALFEFLRAIGLRPIEWSHAVDLTAKAAPSISEILEHAFGEAAAVVVLLTGDDEAHLISELRNPAEPHHETTLTPQPRANVLFEAGMAFGIHQNRTVLVQLGEIRPFSDIAGRYVIRFTNETAKRQELAQRLQAAGCPVDLSGTDWHTAGDFQKANSRALLTTALTQSPSAPPAVAAAPAKAGLATNLEVADLERVAASGFACRVIERKSPYWHLSWKVSVFNKTRGGAFYRIRLDFADEESFVLDHTIEAPATLVAPNQEKVLSGSYLLAAAIATRVSQVTALVSLK